MLKEIITFMEFITLKKVLNNIQVFNSCFDDEVKNLDTHKDYEKSCLIK